MTQGGARGRPRSAESAELTREVFEQLLQAAVAAPSMHNTQPWRFRVRQASRTIELRADPARQLPYSDPDGRAVHIACGAAVFNLRLAAAVAGWQASVLLLPDAGTPLLLATIRLGGRYRVGVAERELHAAIEQRHTNRQPFSSRSVPPGVLAEMAEAARLEGAILHIPDHDESVRLLHLAADAERDLLTDLRYLAELARWTGGQRDREGIPDSALGPRSPEGAAPVRGLPRTTVTACLLRLVRDHPAAGRAVHALRHQCRLAPRRGIPARPVLGSRSRPKQSARV